MHPLAQYVDLIALLAYLLDPLALFSGHLTIYFIIYYYRTYEKAVSGGGGGRWTKVWGSWLGDRKSVV